MPLSRAMVCPHTRPHRSYLRISFWPCSAYCKRLCCVISGWAKTACPSTHSFDGGSRWALGGGGDSEAGAPCAPPRGGGGGGRRGGGGGGGGGGEPCPNTSCLYLHSNLPAWCRSPDPNPPGNWPRKICFETASDWYRPSMLYSKILPASRKAHTSTLPRQL